MRRYDIREVPVDPDPRTPVQLWDGGYEQPTAYVVVEIGDDGEAAELHGFASEREALAYLRLIQAAE